MRTEAIEPLADIRKQPRNLPSVVNVLSSSIPSVVEKL